jgi:hypothetical protein
MEQNLRAGGTSDSLTPSTRLLNQKLGTLHAPRELTPSEAALLLQSKRELAALASVAMARTSTHKLIPVA